MGITYGECTDKKFSCTPDWKCVDFRINPALPAQQEIMNRVRANDWFDVCQYCRYFKRGDHTGKIPII